MNSLNIEAVTHTAMQLYSTTVNIFWVALPVAFLIAMANMYISGEISGGRIENIFRRLIIAIAVLVAIPQISNLLQGLDSQLVSAFGGDQSISEIFAKAADRAKEIKDAGMFNWLKMGQIGLTLISTLSFLVLAVIQHFLNVLHLTTWNLLHILAPISLLGLLFPSWSSVPRGVFIGMFELSLWRPMWVLMARLLIAIGFGTTPSDPSQWFDTAIMNFAVAGLMASTPALVHGFLTGALSSVGAGTLQTAIGGLGVALATVPIRTLKAGAAMTGRAAAGAAGLATPRMIRKKPPSAPIARPNAAARSGAQQQSPRPPGPSSQPPVRPLGPTTHHKT